MYVCVFIDWENIEKSVKQDYGSVLEYKQFVDLIRHTATDGKNRLVGIYAYGDFDRGDAGLMSTLVNLGIEPKHIVTKSPQEYLKGSTDIELSLDVLDTLYGFPHITDYLFVSGDADLRHVVKRLVKQGKSIHLMGFRNATNRLVQELVHNFYPLDDHKDIMRKVTQTEIEKRILSAHSNIYIQSIIQHLNRLEETGRKDFIGLNYLRRRLIDHHSDNATDVSEALTEMLDLNIILTYKVDNPNDALNPTRACKLNRGLDLVKQFTS